MSLAYTHWPAFTPPRWPGIRPALTLWCVSTTDSFEEALILAVNLGHDADTVGAVTGQIAGAFYGASAIPARWLAPLAWRERIEHLADRLVATRS